MAFAKTLFLKLYSSDLFANTVFLLLSAITVNTIQNYKGKKTPLSFFLLAFACVFLLVFLKYSILPACFGVGLAAISHSWFSARKFSRIGIYLSVAFAVSMGLLISYNLFLTGQSTSIANRHPDNSSLFHFQNLRLFDPFIMNAFFFLDVLYQRFGYYPVQITAIIITLLILGWLFLHITNKIRKKQADFFNHLVLAVTVCVVCFLIALSVRYPMDAYGSYVWTYVVEFRYFAPAIFLIILYLVKHISFPLPQGIGLRIMTLSTVTGISFTTLFRLLLFDIRQ